LGKLNGGVSFHVNVFFGVMGSSFV
jgi:hypothetical protein